MPTKGLLTATVVSATLLIVVGAQQSGPSAARASISVQVEIADAFKGPSGFRFYEVPKEFELLITVVNAAELGRLRQIVAKRQP